MSQLTSGTPAAGWDYYIILDLQQNYILNNIWVNSVWHFMHDVQNCKVDNSHSGYYSITKSEALEPLT